VEQEDFKEAGRIKATIKAIEGEDVVREVVTMFEVRSWPWLQKQLSESLGSSVYQLRDVFAKAILLL
jgi:hypothetical protein